MERRLHGVSIARHLQGAPGLSYNGLPLLTGLAGGGGQWGRGTWLQGCSLSLGWHSGFAGQSFPGALSTLTPLAHQLVRPVSPGAVRERRAPRPPPFMSGTLGGQQRCRSRVPEPPHTHTQAPCVAVEFRGVVKRPQLLLQSRAGSKDGQWPAAVTSHFTSVTTPRSRAALARRRPLVAYVRIPVPWK